MAVWYYFKEEGFSPNELLGLRYVLRDSQEEIHDERYRELEREPNFCEHIITVLNNIEGYPTAVDEFFDPKLKTMKICATTRPENYRSRDTYHVVI